MTVRIGGATFNGVQPIIRETVCQKKKCTAATDHELRAIYAGRLKCYSSLETTRQAVCKHVDFAENICSQSRILSKGQ